MLQIRHQIILFLQHKANLAKNEKRPVQPILACIPPTRAYPVLRFNPPKPTPAALDSRIFDPGPLRIALITFKEWLL